MGLFNRIHDFIGVKTTKLKGSLRETSRKMKETKERLKRSEKCRKIRVRTVTINS